MDVVRQNKIDTTVYQIGEFDAQRMQVSERGSPYLRLALWQDALIAILHDDELRAYYDRKHREGKLHGTVLSGACRKLIKRVYVVLKENRPYEVRTQRKFLRFDLLTFNSRSTLTTQVHTLTSHSIKKWPAWIRDRNLC